MRPLFLENPRARWVHSQRRYESPAEYATPVHRVAGPSGYPKLWWLIVVACGLAGLFLTFTAKAQTIVGLHTVSAHAPQHSQNNENWGLYMQHDRLLIGAYRNSIGRDTVYAGYVQPLGRGFDVMLGAAGGYQRKCETVTTTTVVHYEYHHQDHTYVQEDSHEACTGFSRGYFTPALALGWTAPVSVLGVTPKLTVVPGFAGKSSTVFHLSAQWSIK